MSVTYASTQWVELGSTRVHRDDGCDACESEGRSMWRALQQQEVEAVTSKGSCEVTSEKNFSWSKWFGDPCGILDLVTSSSSTLSSAGSLLTLDKDQGNPMVTLHHIYHTHTLWNKRKYSDFPLNTRPVWYAREKDGREWCWWWSSPGKSLKRNAGLSAFSTTDGGKKGKEKLIPHWKKTQAYMKWTPLTPDAFQFYTIALYQLSSFQIELTSLSLSLPPPTPLFLWKYGS